MNETLVWFDYETFGLDVARDRPAQFASIRTDLDLNPLADPLTLYCQPPRDYLPNPESCVLTGISPLRAQRLGVPEHEFIGRIVGEFSVPGTCAVGYNNIRFDDELTRYTLFRNLKDPFAREWQNGNSRWDLLGVMRLARALRPDGLVWPTDVEGKPTLRLDHLTVANGIAHDDAHDALGDVRATLALARRLKEAQPKLFQYLWNLRLKKNVLSLASPGTMTPFLMASARMPSESWHLGIVVVVGRQPGNPNALIICDLRYSPDQWGDLQEAEISPFSVLHVNRAPALAPLAVLRPEDEQRLSLDIKTHLAHLDSVKASAYNEFSGFRALMDRLPTSDHQDVDLGLYGGFASDRDRHRLTQYSDPHSPEFLEIPAHFDDGRFSELCQRFKARNYPEYLSEEERQRWNAFCRSKWHEKRGEGALSVDEFNERVHQLRDQAQGDVGKLAVIQETVQYVEALLSSSV